jgi:hypothetical protein
MSTDDRRKENRVVSIKRVLSWSLLALALPAAACAVDSRAPEDEPLGEASQELATGNLVLNDIYWTSLNGVAGVNAVGARLYSAATGNAFLRQMAPFAAVKIVVAAPDHGRYRVDHAGSLGWVLAADLTRRYSYDNTLSTARINALAQARGAMGFSYWTSNAFWPPTGATILPTENRGRCLNGVHSATGGTEYGADCSGFVSTIWGFPDTNSMTNPGNNGFATSGYNTDNPGSWSTIPMASAAAGDAVVRYDDTPDGTRHIFLIAARENGNFKTYECRGCAQGCLTVSRSIAGLAGWHAIRRANFPLTNPPPVHGALPSNLIVPDLDLPLSDFEPSPESPSLPDFDLPDFDLPAADESLQEL